MKIAFLSFLLLTACSAPCDKLPRQSYRLVLVDRDTNENLFCFTQAPVLDFTSDMTLANSFVKDCKVMVEWGCGFTNLNVLCPNESVDLNCEIDGLMGHCTNNVGITLCKYDSWLDSEGLDF